MSDYGNKFNNFVDIVQKLRSEGGCPWDREQTPESLQRYLSEETGEAIEAIRTNKNQNVKDELGDILYILTLLAQIYDEVGLFDIGDVIDSISAKMVRRHPNVFGDEDIASLAEQRKRWLEIKSQESPQDKNIKKN